MLEITVFICGAAVMILEMVGVRIIAPYLGNSVTIWTALIGVILASLALGCLVGGRLADKRPSRSLLAYLILLAGICVTGTALIKDILLDFLVNSVSSLYLNALLANLLLFAPAAILLGGVTPFAVRLRAGGMDSAGRTVGNLYALSTTGSILGVFVSGFVLIAYLGSTKILFAAALLLALASFLASRRAWLGKLGVAIFIFCTAFFVLEQKKKIARAGWQDLETKERRILVYDDILRSQARPYRVMSNYYWNLPAGFLPSHIQSAIFLDKPDELVLEYTRFFAQALEWIKKDPRLLLLGGGAYSFPRHILEARPGATLDVLEVDPGVTAIARDFFYLKDDPRLRIFHEDGRTFLNRDHPAYDAIFVDVFGVHYSPPFHLTTIETVRRLKALLHPGGLIAVNLIGQLSGDKGTFVRSEILTYSQEFKHVLVFLLQGADHPQLMQNIILVASDANLLELLKLLPDQQRYFLKNKLWSGKLEGKSIILTDEFAPVEAMTMTF